MHLTSKVKKQKHWCFKTSSTTGGPITRHGDLHAGMLLQTPYISIAKTGKHSPFQDLRLSSEILAHFCDNMCHFENELECAVQRFRDQDEIMRMIGQQGHVLQKFMRTFEICEICFFYRKNCVV
jgi:hypothetical protein